MSFNTQTLLLLGAVAVGAYLLLRRAPAGGQAGTSPDVAIAQANAAAKIAQAKAAADIAQAGANPWLAITQGIGKGIETFAGGAASAIF